MTQALEFVRGSIKEKDATIALLDAVQDHQISDRLTLTLQAEIQAIASKLITAMPSSTVDTLMNPARTRVQTIMDHTSSNH